MSQKFQKMNHLTVDEFTTPCPKVVQPSANLVDVEKLMQEHGIRHIPVQDGDQLVGIISERDLFFAYRLGDRQTLRVKDIMQPDPYLVDSTALLSEVAFHMSKNKYGSALVRGADGELGIFTSTDALNALVEVLRGDVLTHGV